MHLCVDTQTGRTFHQSRSVDLTPGPSKNVSTDRGGVRVLNGCHGQALGACPCLQVAILDSDTNETHVCVGLRYLSIGSIYLLAPPNNVAVFGVMTTAVVYHVVSHAIELERRAGGIVDELVSAVGID